MSHQLGARSRHTRGPGARAHFATTFPTFDAVADTVGGPTMQKLLARIKPGGTVGTVVGEPPGAIERGLVVRAFRVHADAAKLAASMRAVLAGDLVIPIAADRRRRRSNSVGFFF